MNWHQFMREERARKLAIIDSLASGSLTISVNSHDVSANMIQEHKRHVAEIESILASAGEALQA